MAATPVFPESEFLFRRAERCRLLASTFRDPIFRDRILEIAGGYDELGRNAEVLTPLQNIKVSELES
jgi:hypothetical protein